MKDLYKLIDEVTRGQRRAFETYTAIIHLRQQNPLSKGEYGERHHIIPRSCGGPNKKWNLVKLTPEEHYFCHYLLTFIYAVGEEHDKMLYAWGFMSRVNGVEIDASIYSRLKRELSEAQKRYRHSEESKRKISHSNKGRLLGYHPSTESRIKMSESHKGKKRAPRSEEWKRKISESRKGQPAWNKGKPAWNKGGTVSEEVRLKISEARKRYWASKKGAVQ